MTQEQKRIAIAEACGWKVILRPCDDDYHYQPTDNLERANGDVTGYKWVEGFRERIPNYLSDLNAMHEAVHSRITSLELQQEYFYQLNDAIGLVDSFSPAWIKEFAVFAHSQATAAQRAEAFGLTLNLWK